MNPLCRCVAEWRLVKIDGKQQWRRFVVWVNPLCSWAHDSSDTQHD